MFKYLIWLSALLITLSGCGGSGSNSRSVDQISTGGLTLLIGDAPEDEFDAILLTVESIILIGSDGQRDLGLTEPVVVDLLQLRNVTERLIDTEIPTGSYSKIRLLISDLELQELEDGAVINSVRPPLPANGKVDLNPQGTFEIRSGQDLIVEIDFDLHRSLKLTTTGNGEYRFRPVVFVDIMAQSERGRLVKLSGPISSLDVDAKQFELCDDGECVLAQLSDSAILVDENGSEIEIGALANDFLVTVFGHFSDSEHFDVLALSSGDENTLARLEGNITSPLTDQVFSLSDDDATVSVMLLDRTLLLDEQGNPAEIASLQLGSEVEAWAILPPGESTYRSIVIQIEAAEVDDEDEVSGQLLGYDNGTLSLQNGTTELCVRVDGDTEFLQVNDDDSTAEAEMLVLSEFASRFSAGDYTGLDLELEVYGAVAADNCYEADEVIIEVEG